MKRANVAAMVGLSLAAFSTGSGEYIAAIFYVVSLLTALSISCAYNLWPLTPAKWILRRFDHSARIARARSGARSVIRPGA